MNENKSYICTQKQKTQMDNKKKNKEEQSSKASEPLAAAPISGNAISGVVSVHDDIDDLNWDHYPIFGPKTAEEAITRVNQAWEDRNDPSKWRTSEDMWNQIYEKYPWLR